MASLSDLEASGEFVPAESILQLKAKTLRKNFTPMRGRPAPASAGNDELAPLIDLYKKHSGNLEAIFGALNEDPGKALKYPPSDANDFAQKYILGKFTYVSNIDKIKQRVAEKAGESVFEGLGDLPSIDEDLHIPEELDDEDAAVHPIDVLKQMFPDVPEEVVIHVWEASNENLEDAAAGLWFMKILQAFMQAGAITVPLPKMPPEEMSIRELMTEIREEGLDATNCIEKAELVQVVRAHRLALAAGAASAGAEDATA